MVNIRRYKDGDEERLWQLYHDTTHIINGKDYTPEQCERWAPAVVDMSKWKERIRASNPFVAEENGKILGFAELERDGHIDYFYCDHEHQRRGIGSRLFKAIEDESATNEHFTIARRRQCHGQEVFSSDGVQGGQRTAQHCLRCSSAKFNNGKESDRLTPHDRPTLTPPPLPIPPADADDRRYAAGRDGRNLEPAWTASHRASSRKLVGGSG